MICRLCLKSTTTTVDIFGDMGIERNIGPILAKYFWFEPKNDDPISTAICDVCLSKVFDFHEFYLVVEEAHRLLTERFSVKTTETSEKVMSTPSNIKNSNSKIYDQSFSKTDKNHVDIQSTEQNLAVETNIEIPEHMMNRGACSGDDDNHTFFNNENFSDTFLTNNEHKPETPSIEIDALEIREPRRTTRSTAARTKLEEKKKTFKRIGRPLKDNEKNIKSKKSCKAKENIDKTDKEYNRKMLEIDEKIARHMKIACDICQESQENFLNLRKHMQQIHRKKGYVICCNKKFFKRSFLTDHIDVHNNPEKFKCTLCDKSFADKQCLRNHELVKHQPEDVKTHQCDICEKRFARQYLLEQHRVTHDERTVPCGICDRRFQNASLLSTHVKMVHTNYGTIMCDICAKVIRGRTAFARHQLEHAGVTSPSVQCSKCGSWHKNKYSLQKHMQRHSERNEQHVCNICGKSSPNRSALLSHQRYVHKSERKFECSVCKKAFKKPINLKEHMAMHTGEVLYRCPHCPKTFNSNANMHSHRKKMHPKEFDELRKARKEKRLLSAETQGLHSLSKMNDEFSTHIVKSNSEPQGNANNIIMIPDNFCDGENGVMDTKVQSIVFSIS